MVENEHWPTFLFVESFLDNCGGLSPGTTVFRFIGVRLAIIKQVKLMGHNLHARKFLNIGTFFHSWPDGSLKQQSKQDVQSKKGE